MGFGNLKTVLDGGGGRICIREDNAQVGELWDNGKMQVLLTLLRDPKEAALLCGGRVRLPPFVCQTTFLGNEKLCFAALHLEAESSKDLETVLDGGYHAL